MICFDSELFPQNFVWQHKIMIEKASIYTMNALNKSSELWHTSVNRKARPVVEGEHVKSWNNHANKHEAGTFFHLCGWKNLEMGQSW